MNYTQNLHLPQWEGSDRIHHEDFNAAFETLDAAVAAAGNCRIATGSYVGTGECGATTPCTLTFDFRPLMVYLDTGSRSPNNEIPRNNVLFRPATTVGSSLNYPGTVQWGEASVTWYIGNAAGETAKGAKYQFNTNGQTYHYIAVGI